MRVSNRHRQRIGGVGAGNGDPGQQYAEHRLHLPLVRAAGADNAFLDQSRGMFGHW